MMIKIPIFVRPAPTTPRREAMKPIPLPPGKQNNKAQSSVEAGRIAIIGANGAGKSRFMEELTVGCQGRAYLLNALSAFYPELKESTLEGSIDALYRSYIRRQSYLRQDAVSELDKLEYLLFADELESLMAFKEERHRKAKELPETRLDILRRIWRQLFPGSRIETKQGRLLFSTLSGNDLIPTHRLSQGEKSALYHIAAVLYAMPEGVIFIESPGLFIDHGLRGPLWNALENARPDCTFIYNSVDIEFVTTRSDCVCIWVRNYDSESHTWDYDLLSKERINETMLMEFAGARRPVMFIEGDAVHSIDMRLYSLVFPEMTVRPLGSCSKVIETTRSFNDLGALHHLRSTGIVDRDRRTDEEVAYLRKKHILVADVAEIENMFLLPELVMAMARHRGRDGEKIMRRIERDVTRMFKSHAEEQALQHVRHKVKRDVECRIDSRFTCITALEVHLRGLEGKLQPRRHYNRLREEFARLIRDNDYRGILKVFNHKPMLPDSGVAQMLGYASKDEYINGVLNLLKRHGKEAENLRTSIRHCLHADEEWDPAEKANEETNLPSNIGGGPDVMNRKPGHTQKKDPKHSRRESGRPGKRRQE